MKINGLFPACKLLIFKNGMVYFGWFGPRGIASVLYLLMTVILLGKEGHERLISVVTLTVTLSIFLHGFTAVPLSKLFKENSN